MLFDIYDVDIRFPLKKRFFGGYSRDEGGRIIEQEIAFRKERLSRYSQYLHKSEESERQRSGARREELVPLLHQIGIQIPSNFDLSLIDLSQLKKGGEARHLFGQRLSPSGSFNANFSLEIDGRYLIFSGQKLYFHSPKYPEPLFLAALDQLEGELAGEGSLTSITRGAGVI